MGRPRSEISPRLSKAWASTSSKRSAARGCFSNSQSWTRATSACASRERMTGRGRALQAVARAKPIAQFGPSRSLAGPFHAFNDSPVNSRIRIDRRLPGLIDLSIDQQGGIIFRRHVQPIRQSLQLGGLFSVNMKIKAVSHERRIPPWAGGVKSQIQRYRMPALGRDVDAQRPLHRIAQRGMRPAGRQVRVAAVQPHRRSSSPCQIRVMITRSEVTR